jgi:glycosyltransferase involved in cell wall biosynthesis
VAGGGADADLDAPSRANVRQPEAGAAPTRRLRVLLLPPQPIGDHAAHIPDSSPDPRDLERRLAAQGIDLVTIDPAGRPFNPFVGKHPMLEGLDPWRALRVMLFERRADLVVSVMDGPAAPLVLLCRLFRFNIPIVLWDIAPAERWQLRKRVQDFVVPRVAGVMTLSSTLAPYIARRWSPTLSVAMIGNRLDTDFFRPVQCPVRRPVDDYIFSIGRDPGRDYPTLLAAMEGVPIELRLRTSRQLAPGADALANVRLLRERVDDRELRDLYAGCRFVVAPLSQTNNAGGLSAIQEAGAMGKALVVTDNPAIRDFIVPDETCLVVPRHDATAMRDAILRLLGDRDLCERLGRNARRLVEETASPAVFAVRFGAALRGFARTT